MMSRSRRYAPRLVLEAAITAMLALSACGGDGSDATDGDLEAFCAAGASIDSAGAKISSPEDAATVFAGLDQTITDLVATAPADLSADAKSFAAIARNAVETGDFSAFEDGTADAIVARMATPCM